MIIVISTIVIAILGKHIVFFLVVFLMGPIHSYAAPIHDFVRAGNLEKLKKFISENPEPLKTVNMLDEETGESPLHIAAARGDFEATLFLLSAGADPRSTTPSLSREAPILPILEAPVTSVDIQPIVSGLSKFADRGKPPVLCREESSSEPIPTSPFTLESYSGEGAHDYYRGFCHGLEKAITVWKERSKLEGAKADAAFDRKDWDRVLDHSQKEIQFAPTIQFKGFSFKATKCFDYPGRPKKSVLSIPPGLAPKVGDYVVVPSEYDQEKFFGYVQPSSGYKVLEIRQNEKEQNEYLFEIPERLPTEFEIDQYRSLSFPLTLPEMSGGFAYFYKAIPLSHLSSIRSSGLSCSS